MTTTTTQILRAVKMAHLTGSSSSPMYLVRQMAAAFCGIKGSEFDRAVKAARLEGAVRLVAVCNRGRLTREEIEGAVEGANELFTQIEVA